MSRTLLVAVVWVLGFANCAAQDASSTSTLETLRSEAIASMKTAASYYQSKVASHGGYVYFYELDLKKRWGEGQATPDQIWVQPPATPAVGLAYVAAFNVTGDAYYLTCVQEVANALRYGQLTSGGWTNSIDFDPQGQNTAQYRNGKGRGKNNSSLDDGQTQTAIEFMVRADEALGFKNAAVHEAAMIALDALLAAQFPCGAFPQVWTGPVAKHAAKQANYPEYDWRTEGRIKNYWELYTLNDNLAVSTTQALLAAYDVYDDPKYLDAVKRLGDFLVMSQMPEPQPAWAQQYNYSMQPVWARRFEPPAICGHETQGIVALLMEIYLVTGDDKYLAPVQPAINFLKRSVLTDGSIARYYELKTNRPLYMEADNGVYALTYDDSNLPSHYSWKTTSNVEMLQQRYTGVRSELGEPKRQTPPLELVGDVQQVIADLDSQGRWIATYQGERLVGQAKFAVGQQYLSSELFNDHLELLATFVAATATR